MPALTINFDDNAAIEHFMLWLCEQGEQDYWLWMEGVEAEEQGNITACDLSYDFKKHKITASCGRLGKN